MYSYFYFWVQCSSTPGFGCNYPRENITWSSDFSQSRYKDDTSPTWGVWCGRRWSMVVLRPYMLRQRTCTRDRPCSLEEHMIRTFHQWSSDDHPSGTMLLGRPSIWDNALTTTMCSREDHNALRTSISCSSYDHMLFTCSPPNTYAPWRLQMLSRRYISSWSFFMVFFLYLM